MKITVGYFPGWTRGPVKDYLEGLKKDGHRLKAATKILADIEKLALFWPHTRAVNITVKTMTGYSPLMELIREYHGIAYRIFFCVQKDRIWLLHPIEKKTQKTPAADIEIAYGRMLKVTGGN